METRHFSHFAPRHVSLPSSFYCFRVGWFVLRGVLTEKVLIILHHTHHHFVCVLTRLYSITYIHENEKNLGKDSLPFLATKQKCSSYFFVFVVVVFFWCSSSNDDFEDDDDVSGKISSKR